MEWDEAQIFPLEVVRQLGGLGYLGSIFPEDLGGAGLGYIEYSIIIEELSRVDGSVGIIVAAHTSLCSNHIYKMGSDEQRRRYLPDITNANRTIREAAERTAINMPFQGSAADLIKLAMIHLHHQIVSEHLPCHMLLQIHDELLFEIPENAVEEMVPRITETMENVWQLEVPLTVEVGQGHTWAEAH